VRAAAPLLLTVLTACSGGSLPVPTVVSVDPSTRKASSSGPVTITLDAVLPTSVDYGSGTATVDDRLTLKIGAQTFGPSRWTDAGVVTDFLPSILQPGDYDVTVTLGDGRFATATDAFRVTPGDWPTGYTFDTIPSPQSSGVPFEVTITAQGAPDGGYGGTVYLSAFTAPGSANQSPAPISPTVSGPFDGGVRTETVTVTVDHADQYQIQVFDLAGHRGTSLPFTIR